MLSVDTINKMYADHKLANNKNIKCCICGCDCISTYMGRKMCSDCINKQSK